MNMNMVEAFIGVGANLGNVYKTFARVMQAFRDCRKLTNLSASKAYRSEPLIRDEGQGDYTNWVVALDTGFTPHELISFLKDVEALCGRKRARQKNWGSRIIDLDLLLYADLQMSSTGLCIPHPHTHTRPFVLIPLLELRENIIIPGRGAASELAASLDANVPGRILGRL